MAETTEHTDHRGRQGESSIALNRELTLNLVQGFELRVGKEQLPSTYASKLCNNNLNTNTLRMGWTGTGEEDQGKFCKSVQVHKYYAIEE